MVGPDRHTFHLVPSGALSGRELLIGAGVAVDPSVLKEEVALLPEAARKKLLVDWRCTLVSPADKDLDRVIEETRGASAIGTTRRGIGPAYAMRALRLSPTVSDLVHGFDFASAQEIYRRLGADAGGLKAWSDEAKSLLEGHAGDVGRRVSELNDGDEDVLFETSQKTLLDLVHGTYPFVTSTHTVSTYVGAALGLPISAAGETMGVMKCYTTRVGGGPFPTEDKGGDGEKIRSLGREFGATTGRPRRTGWLDLVALRYALRLNGAKSVAVSKLDVLSGVTDFKVCVAYKHMGTETEDFQAALPHLAEVVPVYESPFSMFGASYDGGFPREGKKLVDYLEDRLKVKVAMASFGEERGATIEF